MSKVVERSRFYGLDLIRLMSFVAIAFFHISLIHYYELDVPLSDVSIIAAGIEVYSRLLSFSGFTIVLLTSFLTAYSNASFKARLRLYSVLLVAWVILSSLMNTDYDSVLAWDIYPLFIVGIITAAIAAQMRRFLINILGVIGLGMLWVPFWEYAGQLTLNSTLANVFGFANCSTEIAEWPLLPWIGLVWLGFSLGNEMKLVMQSGSTRRLVIPKLEFAVMVSVLMISLLNWGPFYHIQLGDRFSCDAYRMPPLIFWSHLIWPLYLMRISVDPRVNRWLSKFSLMRWVSGLAISRKFWAAYILNYLLTHVLSHLADKTGVTGSRYEPELITWFALIFLPLTELATRGVQAVIQWLDRRKQQKI